MRRRVFVTYFIGLVLLLSSLLYIGYASIYANNFVARDVVVILPLRHDAEFLFRLNDVNEWESAYDGSVTIEKITTEVLEVKTTAGVAGVSAVGRDYFQMVHFSFLAGGPWTEGNERRMILCRAMAWTLFGAVNVVNFVVQIDGDDYVVAGVVETMAEVGPAMDGFAWIPFNEPFGGVLYFRPYPYNLVTARADGEEILEALGYRVQDFTITDINAYVSSIRLRGQILLAISIPFFLFLIGQWLYRLFRLRERKRDWAIGMSFLLITVVVIALSLRVLLSIELWLPAFMGEGMRAYGQLLFNTGLLAPRIYLPAPLAALLDLNIRGNIAFAVGLLGFGILLLTKIVHGGTERSM